MKNTLMMGTLCLAIAGVTPLAYGDGAAKVNSRGLQGDGANVEQNDNGNSNGAAERRARAAQSRETASNRQHLTRLALANLQEVRLSELAATNATDAAVRDFAAQMVEDHSAALEQINALAESLGVTVPTDATRAQLRLAQAFSRLPENRFDLAYVDRMIRDHNANIRLYTQAAQSSASAEVRAFARSQLPALAQHLATALELREALRGDNSTGS